MAEKTFYQVVNEAIADIIAHGFDSQSRIDEWLKKISLAAWRTLTPVHVVENSLRAVLTKTYDKAVTPAKTQGTQKFTIDRVKPELRAELDRRIAASAQLIKLNRSKSIETTLSRFSGWATSVPAGGSKAQDKREESVHIRKALGSLPFEERRVAIDQGHKLSASINDTVAKNDGAIAAIWNSHWRQAGYNYREDHKERDGQVYLLRNTWATERGLVKVGPAGWSDSITQPAEEPFCRCQFQYIYNLQKMPESMLTQKGQELLRKKA